MSPHGRRLKVELWRLPGAGGVDGISRGIRIRIEEIKTFAGLFGGD
jgi:hypothetical protein